MDTNGSAGWVTNLNFLTFTSFRRRRRRRGRGDRTGTGLKGEYFDNPDFTALKVDADRRHRELRLGLGIARPVDGAGRASRCAGPVRCRPSSARPSRSTPTPMTASALGERRAAGQHWDRPRTHGGFGDDRAGGRPEGRSQARISTKTARRGGEVARSSPSTPKQSFPRASSIRRPGGGGGGATGRAERQQRANAGKHDLSSSDFGLDPWGRGGRVREFDHKSSGLVRSATSTVVGSGANSGGWSDVARNVTWSDGTPTRPERSRLHLEHGALARDSPSRCPAIRRAARQGLLRRQHGNVTLSLISRTAPLRTTPVRTPDPALGSRRSISVRRRRASFSRSRLLKTGNNAGFTTGARSQRRRSAVEPEFRDGDGRGCLRDRPRMPKGREPAEARRGGCGLLGAELADGPGLAPVQAAEVRIMILEAASC